MDARSQLLTCTRMRCRSLTWLRQALTELPPRAPDARYRRSVAVQLYRSNPGQLATTAADVRTLRINQVVPMIPLVRRTQRRGNQRSPLVRKTRAYS